MMKHCKRMLALIITLATLISIFALTAAASTKDTTYTLSISKAAFRSGERRSKDNTSRIYYKGTDCVDTYTFVSVRGFSSSTESGTGEIVTVADGVRCDYVVCRKSIDYAISSVANENGYSYVALFFRRLPETLSDTSTVKLTYEWSSDSSGSHKPAT